MSKARPATAPLVSTRDPRLDFFRGIAMFIILIAHTPGNSWVKWIPARWGFSDATETFVFCSGMASAIAFGKVFEHRGWFLGTARVAYRVWQVYWAHIGMFIFIAGMVAWWDSTGLFERSYVGQLNLIPFFEGITSRTTGITATTTDNLFGLLTLRYVPNYFDILPMYMVILVMMPIVVGLHRVTPWLAAAFVVVVWIMTQELALEEIGLEAYALQLPAEPWSTREWFFNPFGWQLIFFTGFALMRGWIPAPPVNWWLVAIALIVVLGNVPLSNIGVRELGFDWARDWRIDNKIWITKTDFGILRYVHFLATAYLAWALAGPKGANLLARGTGWIAQIWAPILAMIMKVGQQSLAVFVTSMVLGRILGLTIDVIGRENRDIGTLLALNAAGFAGLIVTAYLVGWFRTNPWRGKRA